MNKNKAAFFDRDGVLNHLVGPKFNRGPRVPNELKINLESVDAVNRFNRLGFLIVVVTNQPDISRGKLSKVHNNQIIRILKKSFAPVPIHYYECPHDNKHHCLCRKPKNGLIENAILDLDIERSDSFLVGDRWTDIDAGVKSGLRTFFYSNTDSPDKGGKPLASLSRVEFIDNLSQIKI